MEDSGDFCLEGDLGILCPITRRRQVPVCGSDKRCMGDYSTTAADRTDINGEVLFDRRVGLQRSVSAVHERPQFMKSLLRLRRTSFCGKQTRSEDWFGRERTKSDSEASKTKKSGQNFYKLLRNLTKRKNENVSAISETRDQLRHARQTIAALESKMEVYEQLLYGKYQATKVLLHQLTDAVSKQEAERSIRKQENSHSQVHINTLQYSLFCAEDALIDAQTAWLERFNSIVQENTELQNIVQSQTHTIQRLTYDKQVLCRDRQELLALQDAKERMAYQRPNSQPQDGFENTALELAVLGACMCRSRTQQPCACARSACTKQKYITEMQSEMEEMRGRTVQAERIADVYKNAFEEQLQRNHDLMKKGLLAECRKETMMLNLKRIPEMIKKRKEMNDTINSLAELVCEKTDALIQQKLLTKLLAQKVMEIENSNKCHT